MHGREVRSIVAEIQTMIRFRSRLLALARSLVGRAFSAEEGTTRAVAVVEGAGRPQESHTRLRSSRLRQEQQRLRRAGRSNRDLRQRRDVVVRATLGGGRVYQARIKELAARDVALRGKKLVKMLLAGDYSFLKSAGEKAGLARTVRREPRRHDSATNSRPMLGPFSPRPGTPNSTCLTPNWPTNR